MHLVTRGSRCQASARLSQMHPSFLAKEMTGAIRFAVNAEPKKVLLNPSCELIHELELGQAQARNSRNFFNIRAAWKHHARLFEGFFWAIFWVRRRALLLDEWWGSRRRKNWDRRCRLSWSHGMRISYIGHCGRRRAFWERLFGNGFLLFYCR